VWPSTAGELEALQRELAVEWRGEARWQMPMKVSELRVGGVFVASERREPDPGPGAAGDMAWAAAAVVVDGQLVDGVAMEARFDAPYVPGLLAAREGRLLETVVNRLACAPDVLLVNATGRDHPRRAGLALQLGWACRLPTVGVTDRPLLAQGAAPGPLWLDDEVVGYWVHTRGDARAVVAHAGWRTDAETARNLLLALRGTGRTPEPLRQARRLARTLRAQSRLGFAV
jgi:deoxyribonuclease V